MNAPAGRRAQDVTNELLLQLISHQLRFERIVMTQLQEIQAKVAELQSALADSDAKVVILIGQNDALIALTDDIARQLVALGEAGQLPSDALSALITSLDTAKTAALAIGTKAADETVKVQDAIAADTPPAPPPGNTGEESTDPPPPASPSDGSGEGGAAST